ncbi:hypothetical protein DE146DRAFT_476595 [Phaeosphaeria sp. MPI-PUGE-AT-0046c]|nr:hypothetical protein DE146DRAFT_476595 [Phaeosphaeria sp. MPI-PUGE-AT-0046c]
MQSATGRRVLSTLASKLHPQLPLSPRESQQLLTLLTTSFRAHLDCEHPLPETKHAHKKTGPQLKRSPSPTRAPSSYASATQHIDSILTNPLFAVKPARRASEVAAVDVLRDPVAWFVQQIATGAATFSKAAMCLDLLDVAPDASSRLHNGRTTGSIYAEWLRASGTDTSREFVELHASKSGSASNSMNKLVALLFAQGETAAPWRWFIRSQEQRMNDTKLDAKTITKFREQLLWKMVRTQGGKSLDEGIATFMQAFRMAQMQGLESSYTVLRPAGTHLVNRIISTPNSSVAPEVYRTFLSSSQQWLGEWGRAIESMLWLHHPAVPDATPGLAFLQDSTGAITHVGGSKGRRHFMVNLCLGVARQLLEEERYTEAQVAMQFSKEHFSDLVLPHSPAAVTEGPKLDKERRERENLDLLDQLVLT